MATFKCCLTCKKKFRIRPCRINTAKYCSVKCYDRSGENNFYWGKKHTDKIRQKMKKAWVKLKQNGYEPYNKQNLYKKCIICKKNYKTIKFLFDKTHCCSMTCKKVYCSVYIKGEKARNWIDGRSYLPYSFEFNNLIKAKIKERDNYICRNCGIKENLSVHHIDYNKFNNDERNLITLCLKCNSLANGNRIHWRSYYQGKLIYV